MFAFQFFADALDVSYEEGKKRWDQGLARLKRRGIDPPATTKVKPEGARQKTPQLAVDDAAKALALVLQDPLKDFFEKEGKLAWLRAEIQNAGGDPATADAAFVDLQVERVQREADAQSLVLPGLQVSETQIALRTIREGDEVLGSILDYLRWLGVEDANGNTWTHWLGEEFRTSSELRESTANGEVIRYVEKVFPGQHRATPFTNFAGYRLLTKLCLHKSKIAQELYDKALTCLGHVQVGDQRLHEVLDANAGSSSSDARAFVLGAEEAARQEPQIQAQDGGRSKKRHLDLEAYERACLEDDSVSVEVATERLAKLALARAQRDSAKDQLVIVKRQRAVDFEKYEAETKAATEVGVEKLLLERDLTQLERDRAQLESDRAQLERTRLLVERQKLEDEAKAAREERERERLHAAEMAVEMRRTAIRENAARGVIAQAAAEEMLGENRQTPIVRLEEWIRTRCQCPRAPSCSALLSRRFNEEVEAGRHVKPFSHRSETGSWRHFVEHDGPVLFRLHQQIHDRRNGVIAGQTRLIFS